MGCTQERYGRISEERELDFPLRQLGFQFISCRDADLIIRKYSSGGYMSPAQLQEIITRLKLPSIESNEESRRFYLQLCEGMQYQSELLILACVQLCKGDWAAKATLLFEAYDEDTSRSLSREEFKAMWKHLQTLALDVFPAIFNPSEGVIGYLEALRICAVDAQRAAETELFVRTDNVSLRVFRDRLLIGRLKVLLHPRLLRTYIASFYKDKGHSIPTQQMEPVRRYKKKKEVNIDELFGFSKSD